MSSSRLGYPNVNVGKYSNEQNIQNMKSFMFDMSDKVNYYIETLENENEELRARLEALENK